MTQRSEEAGPPQRGTREWYLYKRRMRLQGRSGGRLARFREISKRKQLSIEETVAGSLEPVFVSEFRYYMWNVEPVLCAYCNERLTKQTRTRDHVIPRSAGGENSWENCVVACLRCNRRKGNKLAAEAGMALLREPRAPSWSPIFAVARAGQREAWRRFLGEHQWVEAS